jgi:hypothetical protein
VKLRSALEIRGIKWRDYQHSSRKTMQTLTYAYAPNIIHIAKGLRDEHEDKAREIGANKESKMTAKDYGPSITMARLYKKTSAKGQTYFTGRMGSAKVALLKSNETAESGDEIWNLVVSQVPERPKDSNAVKSDDVYCR